MASRTEKDRVKAQQEKFQAILSNFLKDDDNKYCVDCDAKGPRWASWNLGIFLCIRCAGIHRNLGVHISKVKSVNLDTWTAEQIAMMQEMGNSRARAVYEANIPDGFRRPQTDSALEAFIRAKYEQKKYIAKEWVPPKPVVPREWLEDDRGDKRKVRSLPKPAGAVGQSSASASSQSSLNSPVVAEARPVGSAPLEARAQTQVHQAQPPPPQAVKPRSGSDDLLGLDAEPVPLPVNAGQNDLLADLFGGSSTPTPGLGGTGQQNLAGGQQNGLAEANLFESGGGGNSEGLGEKKCAKDSIMALYGTGGQQQMFGVPGYGVVPSYMVVSATRGMYVPQQLYGNMAVGVPMMQQQPGMMGPPLQQGIMGMQPPMYGGMNQMVPPQMSSGMAGRQPGMMGSGVYMPQGGMQQVPAHMQQMQLNQVQQQMAAMKLGSGQMAGVQQPAAAGLGWGGAGSGQTLSTNLWQ